MAWTAATIVPVTRGSVQNSAAARGQIRNQTMTPVGSSVPAPTGSSSRPAFLDDPAGFLNGQMLPYADILSRIFSPQASPSMPPALAEALAKQAQANTQRIEMQNAAVQARNELPGQIQASRARESAIMPWSLSGLPTALSYRDPLTALQDNTYALRAQQFSAPAFSPINSGWLSPGLY